VLFSTFELALGFVGALAFAQLCFRLYVTFAARPSTRLSGLQLSLLFACATWSIFLSVLAMKPDQLLVVH
jgi:hypothetical protein